MKKVFAILMVVALAAASCGGGGGASCTDLCAKGKECTATIDLTQCGTDCQAAKDTFRSDFFDKMSNCVNATACSSVTSDYDDIFDYCSSTVIPTYTGGTDISGFIDTTCQKMKECDAQVDINQCKTEMSSGDMLMLKLFKESIVNCLKNCVAGFNCTTDFATQFDGCADTCNVEIDMK